jgi:hypothetical protein
MTYESEMVVASQIAAGVSYTVWKLSFARRLELMGRVRDLAKRVEFLEAGQDAGSTMESALLRAEVNRLFLSWGLRAVTGLVIDGEVASPELLAERGPEDLFREALAAVRAAAGLNDAERKN